MPDSSRLSKRLSIAQRDESVREGKRIVDIDLVHSVGGYISEELPGYREVLTINDLQHAHFRRDRGSNRELSGTHRHLGCCGFTFRETPDAVSGES